MLSFALGLYSYEIIESVFVKGNKNVSADEIKTISGIYENMPFSSTLTSSAVKKLMDTNKFNDVKIYKEDGINGVRVIIEVDESLPVKTISIKGNKSIKTDDIVQIIKDVCGYAFVYGKNNGKGIGKGKGKGRGNKKGEETSIKELQLKNPIYIPEYKLNLINMAIKKKYRDKMINDVTIKTNIVHIAGNENMLTIDIKESNPTFIERVDFDGNNNFPLDKLRSVISTKPRNSIMFWEKGKIDYDKITEDILKIEKFYHDNGYPFAKVVSYDFKRGDKGLVLIYTIDEGKKVHINDIKIEGVQVIPSRVALKLLSLKKGTLYSEEKINKGIERLQDFYMNNGYMTTSVNADYSFEDTLCNITVNVKEGNVVTIRKIIIKGNEKTHDEVIRREIMLKPGDVFSKEKLVASYRRLYQLQIFSNIEINPVPVEGTEDQVDLVFIVKEKESSKISGGVSYSEESGAYINLSLSLINLFGYNRTFSLGLNINQTYQNVNFSFRDPNLYYGMMFWGMNMYYTEGERDFYREKKIGGSLSTGWSYIPQIPYLHITGRYLIEQDTREYIDTTLYDVDDSLIESAIGVFIMNGPSMSIIYDSRNHYFIPNAGVYLSLTGEWYYQLPYFENYGEYREFQRYVLDFRTYNKVIKNVSLVNRVSVGVVDGYDDPNTVLSIDRFVLGGTGLWGIRGFPDRSIGVYSVTTSTVSGVIGGRFAALYNMELRYKFEFEGNPAGFVMLFFDAGNTWENFTYIKDQVINNTKNDWSYPFSIWKYGFGVGGRVEIPGFGIMGIDIGYSPQNKEVIPHFQMGFTI